MRESRFRAFYLAGLCFLTASPASAQGVTEACIAAHARGQNERVDGRLLSARDAFIECARDQCPAPVRNDCSNWLAEVRGALPSVLVDARDAEGRDLIDVRVLVDGRPVTERLDGRAIELDPGAHKVRLTASGYEPSESSVLLREGEKSRKLSFVLSRIDPGPSPSRSSRRTAPAPSPRAEQPSGSRGLPWPSYVLGGVAVAGLASFGYFALSGRSQRRELESECAPNCDESDLDPIRQKYLIADISLVVAGVALGAATWFALASDAPARSARPPRSRRAGARDGVPHF